MAELLMVEISDRALVQILACAVLEFLSSM